MASSTTGSTLTSELISIKAGRKGFEPLTFSLPLILIAVSIYKLDTFLSADALPTELSPENKAQKNLRKDSKKDFWLNATNRTKSFKVVLVAVCALNKVFFKV